MGERIRREGAEHEAKGTKREVEGNVQKNVGRMLDDDSEEFKGAVKEKTGEVQRKVGEKLRRDG